MYVLRQTRDDVWTRREATGVCKKGCSDRGVCACGETRADLVAGVEGAGGERPDVRPLAQRDAHDAACVARDTRDCAEAHGRTLLAHRRAGTPHAEHEAPGAHVRAQCQRVLL